MDMADETKAYIADTSDDATTADAAATEETAYQSPEMRDILAQIAEQEKAISDARSVLKDLRAAKRKQARADAKEAERLAREAEQREALDLLRKLRSGNIRMPDGKVANAYAYVTGTVVSHIIEDADSEGQSSE
jgi:septum formation inhibitor MinC